MAHKDYPLTLLHLLYSVKLPDGSILFTDRRFWENIRRSNSIRTYKASGHIMLPGSEIDRMLTDGIKYNRKNAVLIEK